MLWTEFTLPPKHYAIRMENGRGVISKGVDETKDQSYVLLGAGPGRGETHPAVLGGYPQKSKDPSDGADFGHPDRQKSSRATEIWPGAGQDYRWFLRKHKVDRLERRGEGGGNASCSLTALSVGKHKGYPFIPSASCKGLDIALGGPYSRDRDHPETNTVVL